MNLYRCTFNIESGAIHEGSPFIAKSNLAAKQRVTLDFKAGATIHGWDVLSITLETRDENGDWYTVAMKSDGKWW